RKSTVHFHNLGDGKRHLKVDVTQAEPIGITAAGKGRWLLSSFSRGIWLMGADGRLGAKLGLGHIARATPLAGHRGDRFLVEWQDYNAIIDLKTGEVLNRRETNGYGALAFGGRIIVCSMGYPHLADFVEARTGKVLFTLHPLPVGDAFGWVATTPDGFWDGSAGAEKYIAVFRGREFAGEAGLTARRRPGLVRERLKSASENPQ
ncbi:MAG: hypothetical protein QGD94_09020, partial [Planctomycetia bacterium]|nr:hypothetical protein [Planctomycetia bacterium]